MGWFSKKKTTETKKPEIIQVNIKDWDTWQERRMYGERDRVIMIEEVEIRTLKKQYDKVKQAEELKEKTSKLYTDAYVFYQKELAKKIAAGKHILTNKEGITYGYLSETNKVYEWSEDSRAIYSKLVDSSIVSGQYVPHLAGVWLEDRHIPKEVYEYFLNQIKCK
jgi:hypothetical protein